jgi:predicted DNA-binding transcriptional regulator YafY
LRRADRLFSIVQTLRGRRLTTAQFLAERLHVSVRTIYRDIETLSTTGVPIRGEAGVGYALDKDYDIPAIMFQRDEIEALVIGARMVSAWSSTALAESATRAVEKIASAVPQSLRSVIESTPVFAPRFHIDDTIGKRFELARQAITQKEVLAFRYRDEGGVETNREVRPLALHYWGERWTLAAWCEGRKGFRNFRLDRMTYLKSTARQFRDEAGKTYADFLREIERGR